MKNQIAAVALLLMLVSCSAKDAVGLQETSANQPQEKISERGREIMHMLAANPDGFGKSLGTLKQIPSSVEQAIEAVAKLRTVQGHSWPGDTQVGTRYEDFYFLSSIETYEGGNNYDSGYLVKISTGEVRWYHVW